MEKIQSNIKVSAKQAEFLKRFGGKEMPLRISQILSEASFGENFVELNSGTLSRSDYEYVRNFLETIGGKWKGGGKNTDGSPKGKFIFQYVAPEPIVTTFVQQRFLPAKNPLDFFPTPRKAALELLLFAGLIEKETWGSGEYAPKRTIKLKILEPNAGLGGLADVVREFYPDAEIDCIELNPISAEVLRQKGYTVFEQDFLAFEERLDYYDYVVMNPPFDGTTLGSSNVIKNTPYICSGN